MFNKRHTSQCGENSETLSACLNTVSIVITVLVELISLYDRLICQTTWHCRRRVFYRGDSRIFFAGGWGNEVKLYTPIGNLVKPNKLKSKGILSQLSRTYNIHLKTELNWERKLEVNYIDWKIVWENVYSSKASLKAKQFQWKYIYNVIFTEHRLMLMKVSNGKCNICGQNKENIKHLFWECKRVEAFCFKLQGHGARKS